MTQQEIACNKTGSSHFVLVYMWNSSHDPQLHHQLSCHPLLLDALSVSNVSFLPLL